MSFADERTLPGDLVVVRGRLKTALYGSIEMTSMPMGYLESGCFGIVIGSSTCWRYVFFSSLSRSGWIIDGSLRKLTVK